MSWPQLVPVLVGTLLLFLVPGGLAMRAAGLRGIAMWALAGPTTVTLVAAAAVGLPYLSIRLSASAIAALTVAVTLAILLVRFGLALLRTRLGTPIRPLGARITGVRAIKPGVPVTYEAIRSACYLLAFLVPAIIITVRFAIIIGAPENISQTYDNIYHLNAIREIQVTGNGSSMTLGGLTEASQAFYPAAWHDMVSLVVATMGISIPVAVSASNIIIGAVFWPLGCIYLITRITGTRILPVLVTGALASGFSAFPYLMIDFGVLYPNLLSVAILPVALGIMVSGLRLASLQERAVPAALQFVAVVVGLALAHPSTVIAIVGFGAPMMLAWLIGLVIDWRRGKKSVLAVAAAALATAAYFAVGLFGWGLAGQSPTASGWTPRQSTSQAVGEILGNGPQGTGISVVLLILTLTGLVLLARNPSRWWILGVFAVGSALFIIASAGPVGDFRHFWTGVWYNDANRLAAMLPAVTLPVAVIGGTYLLRALGNWFRNYSSAAERADRPAPATGRGLNSNGVAAASLLLVLGLTACAVQVGAVGVEQRTASARYTPGPAAALLTADEMALLKRVPELVPPGTAVYGDPWTGSSLVYAIAGRHTIAPHLTGARSKTELILMSRYDEAGINPAVCPAIRELDAYYALDFDEREINGGEHVNTAMDNAESAPGLELIASEGEAKLYKVTACGKP